MVDMFANAENVRIFAEVFLRPKCGFLAGKARGEGLISVAPLFCPHVTRYAPTSTSPNAINRIQKLCFAL